MLVLNRRVGEAIIVDGDIRIVIVSSDRRGVRLGIEAPAARSVLREELVEAVVAENRRAVAADAEIAGFPGLLDVGPGPRGGG